MTVTGAPTQPSFDGSQPRLDPNFTGLVAPRTTGFEPGLGGISPLGPSDDGSSGGIKGLIRTLKRRQGVFLLAFTAVTGALAVDTLRQRIFSPVYEGGFQIQISNPFEQAMSMNAETRLEAVARSTPKNDVPSLIVLMRSPLLIKPMADRMGVSMREVIDNL